MFLGAQLRPVPPPKCLLLLRNDLLLGVGRRLLDSGTALLHNRLLDREFLRDGLFWSRLLRSGSNFLRSRLLCRSLLDTGTCFDNGLLLRYGFLRLGFLHRRVAGLILAEALRLLSLTRLPFRGGGCSGRRGLGLLDGGLLWRSDVRRRLDRWLDTRAAAPGRLRLGLFGEGRLDW